MVFGVAARKLIELSTVGHCLECVGARCLEQAILCDRTGDIRRDEGLRHQARDGIDDVLGRKVDARCDFAGGFERKTPGKDRQPLEHGAFAR